MAEEKPDFFTILKKIQKYISKPTLVISEEDATLMNKNFPPRYLYEIYCMSNTSLPKFGNQYHLNDDYSIHFKICVADIIEIIREYNKTHSLYPPHMPGRKKSDDFKKKLELLKPVFKRGIGKPELEIFMSYIDTLDPLLQEQYYDIGIRELKKLSKSTVEEMKSSNVKTFASFSDYLQDILKLTSQLTCPSCSIKKEFMPHVLSNIAYDVNDNHVDILMLSDRPTNDGLMDKESYDLMKQFIDHYQFNSLKYVIANVVSCKVEDKVTKETISFCKKNLEKIIHTCCPNVIMALGSTACEALGLDSKGIVNQAGSKVKYDGFDVIINVHPSYVVKNRTNDSYAIFGGAFNEVRNLLKPPDNIVSVDTSKKRPGDILSDGKIYATKKLPNKFYDSEWVLVNIFRDGFKTIDHIFRNTKTNEKVIRRVPTSDYEYYYIMKDIHGISKPSHKVGDLYCKKGPWKFSPDKDIIEKFGSSILYEGNVQLETKATTDYYYFSQTEDPYLPQIFRYDIEHKMDNFHGTDLSAPYIINYMSAEFLGEYYVWILESDKVIVDKLSTYVDNKGKQRKLHINEFGNNESLMLQHFWFTLFVKTNPDIMTAWNGHGFDFPYLINRSKRLPYHKDNKYDFASFDSCYKVIDLFESLEKTYTVAEEGDGWQQHTLTGIIVADLMLMYEAQHQNALESTALDFIADLELDLGKKPFPATNASPEEWIAYNLWDTELLELIDNKVQATNYKFFLSKITRNTWHSVDFSMGIVDGLLLNKAKITNTVLRTHRASSIFTDKYLTSIVGGFTQANRGGMFRLLVDYDAKAMYPSIMMSFNIGPNTLRMTIPPDDAYSIMVNTYDPKKVVEVFFDEMFCVNGMQYKSEMMNLLDVAKTIKEKNYIITPSGGIYCSVEEEKSIFFDILFELGQERDAVKNSMYDKDGKKDMAKYNKQLALKVSANSFYGVYLFSKFMFFNTTLGGSITMTGRTFIKAVMHMIETRYGYSNNDLSAAMKSIVVSAQQDLLFKASIYADTDGCVITFQDKIDSKLPIEKQLDEVEKELKQLNPYIEKVVEEIYPFFNKGQEARFMKFKEDWVADKGLFYNMKHKRYALHVVREGGKPKDELLYRGIQIRRADSPKLIKEELSRLIEMVLRNNDLDLNDIFDEVNKIENKLYEVCQSRKLTLAKSIKFGKPLSQYKNNPQNIESMLLWNALHKREDFKVGSKGYLYNIQRIDYDEIAKKYGLSQEEIDSIQSKFKTDAIAIPQDYESVPDYFDIDIKTTIEKRFTVPYTNILEPIIESSSVSDIPIMDMF